MAEIMGLDKYRGATNEDMLDAGLFAASTLPFVGELMDLIEPSELGEDPIAAGGPMALAIERIYQALKEDRYTEEFVQRIAKNFGVDEDELRKAGNAIADTMYEDGQLNERALNRKNSKMKRAMREADIDTVTGRPADPPIKATDFQLGEEGPVRTPKDEAKKAFWRERRRQEALDRASMPTKSGGTMPEAMDIPEGVEAGDDFIEPEFRKTRERDFVKTGQRFTDDFVDPELEGKRQEAFKSAKKYLKKTGADMPDFTGGGKGGVFNPDVLDMDMVKNIAKKGGLGLGAIALLAALGYGGYKMFSNKGESSTPEDKKLDTLYDADEYFQEEPKRAKRRPREKESEATRNIKNLIKRYER